MTYSSQGITIATTSANGLGGTNRCRSPTEHIRSEAPDTVPHQALPAWGSAKWSFRSQRCYALW